MEIDHARGSEARGSEARIKNMSLIKKCRETYKQTGGGGEYLVIDLSDYSFYKVENNNKVVFKGIFMENVLLKKIGNITPRDNYIVLAIHKPNIFYEVNKNRKIVKREQVDELAWQQAWAQEEENNNMKTSKNLVKLKNTGTQHRIDLKSGLGSDSNFSTLIKNHNMTPLKAANQLKNLLKRKSK